MEKKILFFVAAITLSMASLFAQYDINLSSNPPQGGIVLGGGNYPYGVEVTVIAVPDSCYYFGYWSEDSIMISVDPYYSFIVTQSRNLVANFFGNETSSLVTVSANPVEGGEVTVSSGFPCGEVVTVCAFPNVGYQFLNWTEDSLIVSNNVCYTFYVSSPRHLVANFVPIGYTVTVSAEPPYCGEVFGGGENLPYGTVVTVGAIPSICCDFLYWGAEGMIISVDQFFTFAVTHSLDLVAYFEFKTFDVIASATPLEGGTVYGGGNNILCGDSTFVKAVPNPEYEFVNWTEEGVEVCENAIYAFPVFQSRSLVANFVETGKGYAIIVLPNLPEGGTVYGGGENVPYGEKVTILANTNTDYNFINWTRDGIEVCAGEEYTFTVIEDMELIANFEKSSITSIETNETSTIKIYPNPSGGELKVVSGELKVENIEIYDAFGKRVGVTPVSFSETVVDISHLSAGVYFVKVITETGSVIQKVVKE